ncbi:MAG: hypothetical protein P4L86_20395 [Mycobacterium sp.]|nr:hypothetical protein [Mycobacterium sp.]
MYPSEDEQPTTAFAPPAAPPPPAGRRGRIAVTAAVIAAIVAAVAAIVFALTTSGETRPTAATSGAVTPTPKLDKKAEQKARQAWAHQYGQDPATMANLPDVASATPAQRAAATDLLTRTEAATAGLSDVNAAKAAGFDIAAQLGASEQHNDKVAKRIAEIDAQGAAGPELTIAVLNKSNVKNAGVLDPTAPQALLYRYEGKGAWKVIGARFLANKLCPQAPPVPGGPITRWVFDKGNNLSLRMYFVPGNDLTQAYALKRPKA